jgi:translation elongation factor P/translation initiation factor 5A
MFKVGDIVECINAKDVYCITEGFKYKVVDAAEGFDIQKESIKVLNNQNRFSIFYDSDRFKLAELPKNYFVNAAEFNDNRTLMTEEEAMEYLRKNGGGTLYKKVLTMRIKTKTVEEIEKYD